MTDTRIDTKLATFYDEAFYDYQVAASLASARIYLKHLWQFFQPLSVIDVGCGRGAWLKACHELGSKSLSGFDGDWNSQSSMIDGDINFRSIDLNKPFSVPEKVDLAISVEVAEHLEPSTAPQFIRCLTDAADAVLFGAAYTKQGGTNHINERPHKYWAQLFSEQEFVPFDLFRPVFWGNENVCWWYRQNTFLYIRKNSDYYIKLKASGRGELLETNFMNCIHPVLYDASTTVSFRSHIMDLVPSLGRAIRRRLPMSWASFVPPCSGQ